MQDMSGKRVVEIHLHFLFVVGDHFTIQHIPFLIGHREYIADFEHVEIDHSFYFKDLNRKIDDRRGIG